MEATELIANLLEMNSSLMKSALDGLPDEKLNELPKQESNPVGWLLWHRARVEDAVIAHVTGGSQIWLDGGWGEKFGLQAAPDDIGFGDPIDKVKAMQFSKENLTQYADAVREQTEKTLKSLSPADLDKEVPDFVPDQKIRVGDLLGRALMIDNFHHSGQVCYLRGYYTGYGWLPF